jgi:hypothetical protein
MFFKYAKLLRFVKYNVKTIINSTYQNFSLH